MGIEIIKLIMYSALIILIAKYVLVKTLRSLAENLNLKPRVIGEITGYATSIPEFLTICVSSLSGLNATTVVNIVSSNTINLLQYIFTIILNKNIKMLKNVALIVNLILVGITILIPAMLLNAENNMSMWLVPIFVILYIIFKKINKRMHDKHLGGVEELLEKQILDEEKEIQTNKTECEKRKENTLYIFMLFLVGLALFFIGNNLGDTLEALANRFNISEAILGILLGVVTSIPELITFLESQKHYKKKEGKTVGSEENNRENEILGVVEASNNLITSNVINLFVILSLGIILTNILG